ncbi:MAG: RelA/SpoT domain-containing protein [Candidatus Paceibacterota bacterium]|jgi:ppGpp synthetase/RelA/SpoT-type nucleotidyltranferase
MAWTTRRFSSELINTSGKVLISDSATHEELVHALEIINNWRAAHAFPLNTFQNGLRKKALSVDTNSLIAQRIKRLASIDIKLRRFPAMKLSQMQDLGGCRAIVHTVEQVKKIANLYKRSSIKHKLVHFDDYISQPKPSGYRGVHLIYRYFSDKNPKYNGQKIEIQIRSLRQHAWATAVEIVGTIIKQGLKSNQGEQEWLRFFSLMGSAIAGLEKCPQVPGTPENIAVLKKEIKTLTRTLDVRHRLMTYGQALKKIEENETNAHYYLLVLNPSIEEITIKGFKKSELEVATQTYLEAEERILSAAGAEAVLVSVDSVAALQRAYPNYFLDTKFFVELIDSIV